VLRVQQILLGFVEACDEVKIVGICIGREEKGGGGRAGGFETIVVGGILVDLTTDIRVGRVA